VSDGDHIRSKKVNIFVLYSCVTSTLFDSIGINIVFCIVVFGDSERA